MKAALKHGMLILSAATLGALALLIASVPRTVHGQEPTGIGQFPGANKSLDELKQQFFHVSAGKRLRPEAWPNGARAAVGLSFDVDNASALLGRGDLRLEGLTRGEYQEPSMACPACCVCSTLGTCRPRSSFPLSAPSCIPQMIKDIQASRPPRGRPSMDGFTSCCRCSTTSRKSSACSIRRSHP